MYSLIPAFYTTERRGVDRQRLKYLHVKQEFLKMPSQNIYNKKFYEAIQEGAQQSAREIIPLILELIQPQSVVDVGCGSGTWLSVFQELGIKEYLGIDGAYVEKEILQIPQERFLSCDLTIPLKIDRAFDLVLSLEVAEHLDSEFADIFINSLTNLGPVVLFSAAIPYQGGTNHVNEQWPDYWVLYFQNHGYLVIDCLRKKIWDNEKVEPWYAQNMFFFVRQDCLERYPLLKRELKETNPSQIAIVHPKIYLKNATAITAQTRHLTPTEHPAICTSTGVELRINENRFGSMELEITAVHLLNLEGESVAELDSGAPLGVEIEYLAHHPIYYPVFGITISYEDGLVCYDIHIKAAELPLPLPKEQGRIILHLERLDLNSGQYYVDVGIYEHNWAYAYDYHWHVYPLVICSKIGGKGILSPPHWWEIRPGSITGNTLGEIG